MKKNRRVKIGSIYDYLEVIKKELSNKTGSRWLCKCVCSKEIVKTTAFLHKSRKFLVSCGCKSKDRHTDLYGKLFDNLTVVCLVKYSTSRNIYYQCNCSCGNTRDVSRKDLLTGYIKSCGCLPSGREFVREITDHTGQRFGRLVVTSPSPSDNYKMYLCECDCGKTKVINYNSLRDESTISCGCYCKEVSKKLLTGQTYSTTHGNSYKIEYGMVSRAKFRAKRDGDPFNITIEDIHIPEICIVTGKEIKVCKGKIGMSSPTLDKIIIEKGYVKGNVSVISNEGNILKGSNTIHTIKNIYAYMTAAMEAQENDT